ncbi:MAG TPA: MFS transporter, partial [Verrucomicrobiae bacterium]|nr:MFS transporter [Verrucomicrobiae bacterium]
RLVISYDMATATPASPYTLRTILRHRPFRVLWIAQFVSIFGDFLALFGVILMITYKWHGTVLDVTTVTVAFVLPYTIVGPVAGVFVDHWNVKRVMIGSDLVRAVLIVGLVFVTDIRQVCVIFAVLSTVSSFFNPAQSVTLRTVVPMEGLMAANTMMAQAFYTVRIFSPAVAGLLVKWLGEKSCFYLDAVSFVFSAAMISTLVVQRPASTSEKTVKSLTQDFVAGNKFIFTHATLAFVFTAMAVAMFVLSSFSPLISIYIRDSLGARELAFGIISALVGVGLIVGTQLVNLLVRKFSKARVVLGGLVILGAGAALLGVFHNIIMAGVGTFTIGFAISFVIVPAQTLSQQETPPAMMGRVSSSFMSLFSLAQVLGLLLSGFLAHWLGMRPLFIACAAALVVIAVLGQLKLRETPAAPALSS